MTDDSRPISLKVQAEDGSAEAVSIGLTHMATYEPPQHSQDELVFVRSGDP
jgi:hypothetical protein